MMDSQENALNQGMEETKQENAVVSQNVQENENQELRDNDTLAEKVYTSKKEIVERTKVLAENEEMPEKAEIDHLKTSFYRIHTAERDAQQKAYLEAGGAPENYQIMPDEEEEAFKAAMNIIKEKRQKAFLAQEELKRENLKKKEAIIEKIKTMVTTPEEANNNFQEFKALQQDWKTIKPVPAENVNELWRNYQLYVEQFYDLLNLNREAREYDFKRILNLKLNFAKLQKNLQTSKM